MKIKYRISVYMPRNRHWERN